MTRHVPFPLPLAWRAAIAICPYCSGTGCIHCDGSGDLFGTMLLEAYCQGRDHVLLRVREVEAARRLAVERVTGEMPTAAEMKRTMGL